jgi:hypothetical protein
MKITYKICVKTSKITHIITYINNNTSHYSKNAIFDFKSEPNKIVPHVVSLQEFSSFLKSFKRLPMKQDMNYTYGAAISHIDQI